MVAPESEKNPQFKFYGTLVVMACHFAVCFLSSYIAKNTFYSKKPIPRKAIQLKSYCIFMFIILGYVFSLKLISPSLCSNSSSIIIFYLTFRFVMPYEHINFRLRHIINIVISGVLLVVSIIFAPPTYDNMGVTEMRAILFSPFGIILFLILLFIFFICYQGTNYGTHFSPKRIQNSIATGISFLFIIIFCKAFSAEISLTFRIENQFKYIDTYLYLLIAFIFGWTFIVGIINTFEVSIGVTPSQIAAYFIFLNVLTILTATLVFGDVMMLFPIPIGVFVSSSSLFTISLVIFCFNIPINTIHTKTQETTHIRMETQIV